MKKCHGLVPLCSEQQRIKAQIYADHKLAPAYQVSCDIGFKGSTLFSPEFLNSSCAILIASRLFTALSMQSASSILKSTTRGFSEGTR